MIRSNYFNSLRNSHDPNVKIMTMYPSRKAFNKNHINANCINQSYSQSKFSNMPPTELQDSEDNYGSNNSNLQIGPVIAAQQQKQLMNSQAAAPTSAYQS